MKRAPSLIKTYSDEALLEEVRRVAGLVRESVLTSTDFAKHAGISASTIASRFGGWRNALERAGLAHMDSGEPESAFKLLTQPSTQMKNYWKNFVEWLDLQENLCLRRLSLQSMLPSPLTRTIAGSAGGKTL